MAAVLALIGTACGVDSDRTPRDVQPEERPTDANAGTSGGASPGTGSTVYFLGQAGPGENAPLTAVGRDGRADAAGLLTALFDGPTPREQDALGLRTAIPFGTKLLGSQLDSAGTLQIDVSSELLTSAGDVLLDGVAQIVFTGSELEGVQRIRLLVEGEPQDWPTSSGNSTRGPLSIFDFPDRIPFSQPDYPAIPSPTVTSTTTEPTSSTVGP
jgi:spore germination protein GerM